MRPAQDIPTKMRGAAALSRQWSTSYSLPTRHYASWPESYIPLTSPALPLAASPPWLAGAFDRLTIGVPAAPAQADASAMVPAGAGVRAISQGFPLVASGDQEIVLRSAFLYDALYASIQASLPRPFTLT